jgi:hypothetical protein
MRATSSVLCNSIRDANLESMETNDLAELQDTKAGSYSLLLKNFPCRFFRNEFFEMNITGSQSLSAVMLQIAIQQ